MTLRMRIQAPLESLGTTLGGEPLAAESLSFSIRNFGRRLSGNAVAYEMRVDAADFLMRFRPIYDECLEELKREDALMEQFEPLYSGATSYPSLEAFFLLNARDRMQIVRTHFTFDVLRLYFIEDVPGVLSKWALVSLDLLERESDVVTIAGHAVRR